MQYYRTDDNRQGRVAGIAAGVGYVLVWVVLMLFWKFSFAEQTPGGGIMIDFGDTEFAAGLADPEVNDITNPDVPDYSAPDFSEDEILTQDLEEAPEVTQPDRSNTATTQPAQTQQPRDTERPPQEQPRTVNQQALFPGRTENSTSQSEGSSQSGAGNQGSPDGSPQGDHEGTGTGGAGTGFSLAGRTVVGALASPSYGTNKQGRVVVEITVNPAGNVIGASYRATGSTTNDSQLVAAALEAAKKSRFNKIEAEDNQTGTITYNFRLK